MTDQPKVYEVDLDELKPDPSNANKGSERGQYMLDSSIAKTGLHRGVAVDANGYLVAGNKTHQAAIDAGFKKAIVVETDGDTLVVTKRRDFDLLDGSDDNRARLAAYYDNRTSEVSLTWDAEQLFADMQAGLPLDQLWRKDELDELLAGLVAPEPVADPGAQVDRAEELRQKWGTESGQLWILDSGKGYPHRLICGDCTDRATVERLMGGERAGLMVTDPPYGVEYDPAWRAEAGVNKNKDKMGRVENDGRVDWSEAYILANAQVAYVWHAGRHASEVQEGLEGSGYTIIAQIIWSKDRFALSRGDYHWQHEPCWYAVKKGQNHNWQGARDQSTVWEIDRADDSGHGHGTQKPIECMARPIRNNTAEGEIVYDPFLGSGTTLIACEQLSRQCRAVEISPGYVAVCLERWSTATGHQPVLVE